MKNCLYTKLDCSVDNENLPVLGSLIVSVNATSGMASNQRGYRIRTTDRNVVVKVKDGKSKISLNSDLSSPTNVLSSTEINGLVFYVLDGDYAIEIENKYNLLQLGLSLNVDTVTSIGIKLEDIQFCKDITTLNLVKSNVSGDLSVFSDFMELTSVQLYKNIGIFGSIESFAKSIGLSTIRLQECSNVNGSINVLCNSMVTNGRTSGTLLINVSNTKATLDGNILTKAKTINFGSSMDNPTTEETAQGWQVV